MRRSRSDAVKKFLSFRGFAFLFSRYLCASLSSQPIVICNELRECISIFFSIVVLVRVVDSCKYHYASSKVCRRIDVDLNIDLDVDLPLDLNVD